MPKSFAAHPPKVFMQPINQQGGGNYRILQPASLLRRHGYAVTQAHPHPVTDEALKILDPDVVVFQLYQTEKQQKRIQSYRKALPNAHFVYEIDDLFWAVPQDSFHQNNPLLPTSKTNIRTTAKLCDSVTVTTPELAEEMRKLLGKKDIRVVPNQVPTSFINAAIAGRRKTQAAGPNEKPRIGWAGGIGHAGDLKILPPIMQAFGDEVQWVFLGMMPSGVAPGPNIEVHAGVPFNDYPQKLGELNLDLALAPLEANDFNRCKSDLRVLEYGAAGYPVIASDGPTYRNCPVKLCMNEPQQWIDMIRGFLNDRDAWAEYAENLHTWVKTERCMESHLPHYIDGYLPKNSIPFIPHLRQPTGDLVTVGASFAEVPNYATVADAWAAAPGSDILYVRPNTMLSEHQAARLIHYLGGNASVSPLTNDGMYPAFGKFIRLPIEKATTLDVAAMLAANEPIQAPFPGGPVVLMSGSALARFGLPDETRFGNIEYSMADWGARCMEGGRKHVTVSDTFVYTDTQTVQAPTAAQHTLEHLAAWMPGFVQVLQAYQQGDALTGIREDLELAYNAIAHKAPAINSYPEWYDLFQSIGDRDRAAMNEDWLSWEKKPKISIIMPTYNTPIQFLREAFNSVLAQTYPFWELVAVDDASTDPEVSKMLHFYAEVDERVRIAFREENGHICKASNTALGMATGEWAVFLDHDDTLAPHALYMMAREIVNHPEAEFIYSDSDKIGPDGVYKAPYLTPDFSYELLLAQNFVTHLCAYKLDQVKAIGSLTVGMEGSQDWDLVLRYLEAYCGTPPDRNKIRHVHSVLYHWRESEGSTAANVLSKPYAIDAGRKAVVQHLSRTKQMAFVGQNPIVPIFNMVRFLLPDEHPKVSIIIPTKDNSEQLLRCLGSLFVNTIYNNYDVILLNNGKKPLNVWPKEWGDFTRKIRVRQMSDPFNYAAFNNYAVSHLAKDAEFVCLMNDDVEVIERTWLMDMVGLAQREGVGAVGPKLLYPNDQVQAAGIIFSAKQAPGQSALHLWQRLGVNDPGQTGRAVITQPVIAVTGACMVIRRQLWLAMDGMDDTRFPVDYNDVDLCLRLHKAGYRSIVSAQSLMRHHEGHTKRRTGTWRLDQMLAAERELLALHGDVRDPYINPGLVFGPQMNMLSRDPPECPWLKDDIRPRVLVVNGGDAKARELFKAGFIPFSATTEGHFLVFSEPAMPAVQPIDMREDTEQLLTVMSKLAIDDGIRFCAIGDGTLGMLGFFAAVAAEGVKIVHDRAPEQENRYYTARAWTDMWEQFHAAVRTEDANV